MMLMCSVIKSKQIRRRTANLNGTKSEVTEVKNYWELKVIHQKYD